MAYATVADVQARMTRPLSVDEETMCTALLEDAAVIIDAFNVSALEDRKQIVSCRMVIRQLGDGNDAGVPIGATQGSMAGLGYSQSWTVSNGSTGEMYLSKLDKEILGVGNKIGSYSPVEELSYENSNCSAHC
jgi:hypothetical protein